MKYIGALLLLCVVVYSSPQADVIPSNIQSLVDELAEANILMKKVEAAKTALEAGFVDNKEAREIFNTGQIKLKLKDTPVTKPLPEDNKKLIDNWKKIKKAELDRLEEQLDD